MAVGNWANAVLADYDDVLERYERVYDLTGETVLADQQAAVTAKLAQAKELIGNLLTIRLRQYIETLDLDADADIRDQIENPTVFKDAAVAWALKLLFEDNAHEEGDYHHLRMGNYQNEFTQRFDMGFALLRFDKDVSGDIEQSEAASGPASSRFYRI